jgi:hypothetical protein
MLHPCLSEGTITIKVSENRINKPFATRRIGKPKLRWLDSVEEDLKKMGVKNWRRKKQGNEQWNTILEEAKVHQGLKCQKTKKKGFHYALKMKYCKTIQAYK